MSHPNTQTQTFGDVEVRCKSFNINLILYRSIGTKVEVRGEEMKRRWWCLWLCKTKVPAKADILHVENTYFSVIDNMPVPVRTSIHDKTCNNASDCKLHHWAVGVGVKITFPNGDATPDTINDLLPLHGVTSIVRVTNNGSVLNFSTGAGIH